MVPTSIRKLRAHQQCMADCPRLNQRSFDTLCYWITRGGGGGGGGEIGTFLDWIIAKKLHFIFLNGVFG